MDPDFTRYGSQYYVSSAGLAVFYDTRDMPLNAYEGYYIELQAQAYGPWLGSEYTYGRIKLDYRHYFTTTRPGSTLAFNLRLNTAFGEFPWSEFPSIGSESDLRGYLEGRYRDDIALYGIAGVPLSAPQRQHPRGGLLRRSGSVAPSFDQLVNWLPSFGVGYRLEVQPRMNVRVDVGLGFNGGALHIGFVEAF